MSASKEAHLFLPLSVRRRSAQCRGVFSSADRFATFEAQREGSSDASHRAIALLARALNGLGVPYHRGYLFYGPPGTGKTSLVSALAAKVGMSIYVVNLAEMNDRALKKSMNWVPENSMILFEDIDCMKTATRRLEMDYGQVQRDGDIKTSVSARAQVRAESACPDS